MDESDLHVEISKTILTILNNFYEDKNTIATSLVAANSFKKYVTFTRPGRFYGRNDAVIIFLCYGMDIKSSLFSMNSLYVVILDKNISDVVRHDIFTVYETAFPSCQEKHLCKSIPVHLGA